MWTGLKRCVSVAQLVCGVFRQAAQIKNCVSDVANECSLTDPDYQEYQTSVLAAERFELMCQEDSIRG